MDPEQALRERAERLARYLNADPDNIDLACELADVKLQLGEIGGQLDSIALLSRNNPDHLGLRFRHANALLATENFAAARDELNALLGSGVDNVALRYNLALSCLCLGDADASLKEFEAAGRSADGYPHFLLLKARALHRLKRYDEALDAIDRYTSLAPGDVEAASLEALVRLDGGDSAAARRLASDLVQRKRPHLEALLAASGAAIIEDHFEEAEKTALQALSLYPESGRAWSCKAQAELARGSHAEAKVSLYKAVEYMPDHIGSWHMLAWCQLLDGEIELAEQSFEQAYDIDRNFDETHGGLAVIAAFRGKDSEAKASIRRAKALNPLCYSARYAESVLLEREGKHEAAQKLMDDLMNGASPSGGVPISVLARKLAARLEK